jgi:hypothetical protein
MTDKPRDDAAALREELWQAYLYKFMPSRPASNAERHHAALVRLAELQRETAKAPDDIHAQYKIFQSAIVLTQLLVAEIGAPFLKLKMGSPFLQPIRVTSVPLAETADRIAKQPSEDPEAARLLLLGLLDQQAHACPPTHRRALEPAVAIVPRKLLSALYNALAALDVGETAHFLTAAPTRRQRPWSFDQARLRALEHRAFLLGQGRLKMKAINFEIHKTTGVTENTLRGWRTELRFTVPDLDARLEAARMAGALAKKQERDPNFGSRPGETIDANVRYLTKELRDNEPLISFGARYRREFSSAKSKK